jgi:hypothetical protein
VSCGLHDVLGFEQQARPSVLVATDVFATAAAEQAALLGAPGLRRVLVAHPVQDRTDDEMRALAVAVVDELLGALTA